MWTKKNDIYYFRYFYTEEHFAICRNATFWNERRGTTLCTMITIQHRLHTSNYMQIKATVKITACSIARDCFPASAPRRKILSVHHSRKALVGGILKQEGVPSADLLAEQLWKPLQVPCWAPYVPTSRISCSAPLT